MRAQNINGIGYIYYESFSNTLGKEDLQHILRQIGSIDGLIIDIRDNTGGLIIMADTLASSFITDEEIHVGYTRYREGKGKNDYSDYFAKKIANEDSIPVYSGNIAVLTNRMVYSAANLFASMMKAVPNVTLIGDTTGGGGGLPNGSELYNGWQVWLSTNPMYDTNKKSLEEGVAPDIVVNTTNSQTEDAIIEAAITHLKQLKGL